MQLSFEHWVRPEPAADGGRLRAVPAFVSLDASAEERARTDVAGELAELEHAAEGFVTKARAESTRRVVATNWARFEAWCAAHSQPALPASVETVALYVTHLAQLGREYATIRLALWAIGDAHATAGVGRPDRAERIQLLMRGIGRSIGTRAKGAPPVGLAELEAMVKALHGSVRGTRDRALLLLGFAGAYRSSDLAALDLEHLCFSSEGLTLLLPRSKEDQLGRGRRTHIPADAHPELCAVRAVRAWIECLCGDTGPLFRVIHGSTVTAQRIHPRAVSRAIQRAACRARMTGARYTSHSLRRGFATVGHENGLSLREIQEHGGWGYMGSLARYIDLPNRGASRNVVARLLRSETARTGT